MCAVLGAGVNNTRRGDTSEAEAECCAEGGEPATVKGVAWCRDGDGEDACGCKLGKYGAGWSSDREECVDGGYTTREEPVRFFFRRTTQSMASPTSKSNTLFVWKFTPRRHTHFIQSMVDMFHTVYPATH